MKLTFMRTLVVVICLGIAAFVFRQIGSTKLVEMTITEGALYVLALVLAAPALLAMAQFSNDGHQSAKESLLEFVPFVSGVLVMLVVLNF